MARWVSGLPNVTLIYSHCTLTWVSGLPTSQFGLSSLDVFLSLSSRMITVRIFCISADWLRTFRFDLFCYFLELPRHDHAIISLKHPIKEALILFLTSVQFSLA